jgi:molybdopterin-guanine dinucleotide biosynthesis adapter protein
MIPIFGIVGRSGSGKTGVMLALITEFKSLGLRPAALKHTHREAEFDAAGKDSYRFSEAGSACVGLFTPGRIYHTETYTQEFDYNAYFSFLQPKTDIILAEGFKEAPWNKLEVMRAAVSREPLFLKPERLALICDWPHPERNFSFDKIKELARFLLNLIAEGRCSYV